MIRTHGFLVIGVVLQVLLGMSAVTAADPEVLEKLAAQYPALDRLYRDLHQNPELSGQEAMTAAKVADRLRTAGYEVTEGVGGFGVVGVLRNGDGATILLRTDMDALPLKEETGLPYASNVTARSETGESVPVTHACGHDVHMTSWVGASMVLAQLKDRWRGTLVFVAQPAEEIVQGASRMIDDGLFTRFPKPDFVVGLHVSNALPAGQVGMIPGPASAACDSVDITFYGSGGHGAMPHRAVDPLVIAARAVGALQTIVSREVDPLDAAVVTVGSFHSGTKRNVIPGEARLQLTVRSYKPEVQRQLLDSIGRIARAEAAAGNAPREPDVVVLKQESSAVVVNDPVMTERLREALKRGLGEANVHTIDPLMTSEDFGVYGTAAGAPAVQLRIGAIREDVFFRAQRTGNTCDLPGPHSPLFAPDPEPTIKTGAAALALSALELLKPASR